jgi:DHA1 family bicyclomycin/chloramphenicol resistance-like MFS transporter
MTSNLFKTALVLGLLSAIGPFAIDMYLPALPAIGQSLSADVGAVQKSLMAFFISLAVGQLVYGPASDMFGRKPPLYVGLTLFVIGSIGCALAPNIQNLIAFRFLQGLGAGAALVVPRAIVRDLHTGNEAARLMGLLMLVFSVSPILAPLAGSMVSAGGGWRGIFWTVTVAGVLGLALVASVLRETRPEKERVGSTFVGSMQACVMLLKDRHFMGLTCIGGLGMSSFFAYLANSSFVLIDHYGLSPSLYSVAFSVNAVAFIGSSQFTSWFGKRFGLQRVVSAAALGYALTMLSLLALWLLGVDRLAVLISLLFIGYGFLGLILPATAVLAMEAHGAVAGTASALMGMLQLLAGAVVIAITGLFLNGTALPMVGAIAACASATLILTRGTLGGKAHTPQVAVA